MSKYSQKNIVLGIGIGFILAAVVNINASNRPMTVEEIKKEAEKHNLIILTKEQVISQQQTDKGKEPAVTPVTTPAPTPTATPPASDEKVTIRIKRGTTSEQLAKLLEDVGLIKDDLKFIARLEELDKTRKLKIGEFTVRKDLSMDELVEILTQ